MCKPSAIRLIVLALLVSLLANTFGWSFNSNAFTHELTHHHRELFLMYPEIHLELHHALDGNIDLDPATHLCLHAAGKLQVFYLPSLWQIQHAVNLGEIVLTVIDSIFPEIVPDRLYHPPRLLS